MKNVWRSVWVWASSLFVVVHAQAQTQPPNIAAQARALYDEGKRLMVDDNFAEACSKFQEVTKLVPEGVGARLALGTCYEKSKSFAPAWAQYGLAESYASRAGKNIEAESAREGMERIRSHLVFVKIVVSDEVRRIPGLSVHWDGEQQEPAMWGTSIPVDVGKHQIEVQAPVHHRWVDEVIFNEGGTTHDIHVPVLEPVQIESPWLARQTPNSGPMKPVEPSSNSSWKLPVGAAAIAVGVVGVVAGGVLGDMAVAKRDESNTEGGCRPDDKCPARGVALREDMLALAHGSTVGLAVGGLLVAGGVTLLAVNQRQKPKESKRTSMSWQTQIVPGGLLLRGAW